MASGPYHPSEAGHSAFLSPFTGHGKSRQRAKLWIRDLHTICFCHAL